MAAQQWRNDQSGGAQATGRKVPAQDVVQTKTTSNQTDNWTGKGTEKVNLKRVPGV